jgi:hypothetical protein
VTAGHGIASGGGWGATGAQVIPRLQLVNAAPAVSYGCRLSLLFIFVFIYFFYFFSGSPPPYCNHNMCATLAHIISNTSSFLPVFFFYFRVSNVRAALSACTFEGLQETGMRQSTIFDTLLPLGSCFVQGCVWQQHTLPNTSSGFGACGNGGADSGQVGVVRSSMFW